MYCRVLSHSFHFFAVLVVWHPYSRPYASVTLGRHAPRHAEGHASWNAVRHAPGMPRGMPPGMPVGMPGGGATVFIPHVYYVNHMSIIIQEGWQSGSMRCRCRISEVTTVWRYRNSIIIIIIIAGAVQFQRRRRRKRTVWEKPRIQVRPVCGAYSSLMRSEKYRWVCISKLFPNQRCSIRIKTCCHGLSTSLSNIAQDGELLFVRERALCLTITCLATGNSPNLCAPSPWLVSMILKIENAGRHAGRHAAKNWHVNSRLHASRHAGHHKMPTGMQLGMPGCMLVGMQPGMHPK